MAKLIYSMLGSVDGYYTDAAGRFDWAAPDETLHAFVNDLERSVGTYLYGRRMYDTMVFWEDASFDGEPAVYCDYAEIWRAADKVVYSRSLDKPSSAMTRIESDFDPEVIRELKTSATADISIGGGELAGQALAAGLVDEMHLFVFPIIVGGGKRVLPKDVGVGLELLDEHRFASGVVHLGYRVHTARKLDRQSK